MPGGFDAAAWGDAFALAYRARSCRNRERRHRRREADARRREARTGRGPAPELAGLGDTAREHFRSRRALIRLRLDLGFRWHGGAVAGNPAYWRPAFAHLGLVSDEHPVLQLFVTKLPRARALVAGDTKAEAGGTDCKLLACDAPYVEGHKGMRGFLRVELDRVFAGGFVELVDALAACGAPMPNLVAGHLDPFGRLHHPHLLWLLAESVCFTDRGRKAPQGLWKATLAGLTAKLLPIGADPGGAANPMRVKNPLSPLWSRAVLAEAPYSLELDPREGAPGFAALAPALDLSDARARLREAAEVRRGRPVVADHPDPAIAGQSNVLFRHLSRVARSRVRWHRDHGSEGEFRLELAAEALRIVPGGRGTERAARGTAWSVAAWTWAHYRTGPARPRCATPEERLERLSAGARAAAGTKGGATLAAVVEAIGCLSAAGRRPTQAAVAEATGKGERTVRRHWPAALAAAAEPAISLAIDKKPASAPPPPGRSVGAVPVIPEVHGPLERRGPVYGGRRAETAGGPSGSHGGGWRHRGRLVLSGSQRRSIPSTVTGPPEAAPRGAGRRPAGGGRVAPSLLRHLDEVEGVAWENIAALLMGRAMRPPKQPP